MVKTSVGKKVGAVALVLGASVGLGVAATGPASAASSYIGSNSGGANLRTCANTGCTSLAYLRNGTGVSMQCYTDAQTVSPPQSDYTSARWFKVSSGGRTGYVHSSLVENQTRVGRC